MGNIIDNAIWVVWTTRYGLHGEYKRERPEIVLAPNTISMQPYEYYGILHRARDVFIIQQPKWVMDILKDNIDKIPKELQATFKEMPGFIKVNIEE